MAGIYRYYQTTKKGSGCRKKRRRQRTAAEKGKNKGNFPLRILTVRPRECQFRPLFVTPIFTFNFTERTCALTHCLSIICWSASGLRVVKSRLTLDLVYILSVLVRWKFTWGFVELWLWLWPELIVIGCHVTVVSFQRLFRTVRSHFRRIPIRDSGVKIPHYNIPKILLTYKMNPDST